MRSAVVLRDLTKRFGAARGITAVDLDVPAGGVFGFLGPNGAGNDGSSPWSGSAPAYVMCLETYGRAAITRSAARPGVDKVQ
jgi:hypothetical protein